MNQLGSSRVTPRSLGAHVPRVFPVGLGTMGFAGFYGAASERDTLAAVHRAIGIGVNLFNTADFYGRGEVERQLGRALQGQRDRAIIVTKIGMRLDQNQRPTIVDGSPQYLRESCDASLKRLRVDAIDIIILCRLDPHIAIEESVGALGDLVQSGKARAIGLSEVSAATIRRAQAVHPIAAVESEYSLWERHVERAILPTTRELSIGLLAHTPLGRGFLTGVFRSLEDLPSDDLRRHHPRFEGKNFSHNRELFEFFAALADEKRATPAQLALAWLLAKSPNVIAIPGTKRAERVEENAQAVDIEITADDLRRLDELLRPELIAGPRQAPFYLAAVDQD